MRKLCFVRSGGGTAIRDYETRGGFHIVRRDDGQLAVCAENRNTPPMVVHDLSTLVPMPTTMSGRKAYHQEIATMAAQGVEFRFFELQEEILIEMSMEVFLQGQGRLEAELRDSVVSYDEDGQVVANLSSIKQLAAELQAVGCDPRLANQHLVGVVSRAKLAYSVRWDTDRMMSFVQRVQQTAPAVGISSVIVALITLEVASGQYGEHNLAHWYAHANQFRAYLFAGLGVIGGIGYAIYLGLRSRKE